MFIISTKISTFLKNIREGAHSPDDWCPDSYQQKLPVQTSPLLYLPHRNKYEGKTALQREHLIAWVTAAGQSVFKFFH